MEEKTPGLMVDAADHMIASPRETANQGQEGGLRFPNLIVLDKTRLMGKEKVIQNRTTLFKPSSKNCPSC